MRQTARADSAQPKRDWRLGRSPIATGAGVFADTQNAGDRCGSPSPSGPSRSAARSGPFYAIWFQHGSSNAFPWGTFFINVTGSLAIGVVLQLALSRSGLSPYVRLFFATGILGGYTTFSTYAFEIYNLAGSAPPLQSIAYALGSVILGVAAAFAGTLLARTFAP